MEFGASESLRSATIGEPFCRCAGLRKPNVAKAASLIGRAFSMLLFFFGLLILFSWASHYLFEPPVQKVLRRWLVPVH